MKDDDKKYAKQQLEKFEWKFAQESDEIRFIEMILDSRKDGINMAAKFVENKCGIPFPIPCFDSKGAHKLAKEIRSLVLRSK